MLPSATMPDSSYDKKLAKQPRRHPLFGRMKGMVTLMPQTDLTKPADPDWADIAWGKQGKLTEGKEKK
jgi:hypothetical protein